MKNYMKCLIAVVAMTTMVGAYAQKPKTPQPKTMTCPSCHMAMGLKKTAATPVAIKTKNGTYYCCAGCASGKAALKAATKKKKV
jgi:uncharacterized protein with FMN-binding domain